jgi:hypothetical protein
MNLRDLIQKIRNRNNSQEQLSNEMVLGFLRALETETVDHEEITCDELYEKLDEYVEREVDKKDAARIMPLMREHLDICPECCEEYEALLRVVEITQEKPNDG